MSACASCPSAMVVGGGAPADHRAGDVRHARGRSHPRGDADLPARQPVERGHLVAARRSDSAAIIASIGADRPLGYNLDMNFVIVPPDQPKVPVRVTMYPAESDPGPFPVPAERADRELAAVAQRRHRRAAEAGRDAGAVPARGHRRSAPDPRRSRERQAARVLAGAAHRRRLGGVAGLDLRPALERHAPRGLDVVRRRGPAGLSGGRALRRGRARPRDATRCA